MVWPWKVEDKVALIDKGDEITKKVLSYSYEAPDFAVSETWIAFVMILFGAGLVVGTEKFSKK